MIFELNHINNRLHSFFEKEGVKVESLKVNTFELPAMDFIKENYTPIKALVKTIMLDAACYQGDSRCDDSTAESVAEDLWNKIKSMLAHVPGKRIVHISPPHLDYNPNVTYVNVCRVLIDIAVYSYDGQTFHYVQSHDTPAGVVHRSMEIHHQLMVQAPYRLQVFHQNVLRGVQGTDTDSYFSELLARFDLEVEAQRSKLVKMHNAGLTYDKVQEVIDQSPQKLADAAGLLGQYFKDPSIKYREQGEFEGFQVGNLIYTPTSILELILIDGGFYGELKPHLGAIHVDAEVAEEAVGEIPEDSRAGKAYQEALAAIQADDHLMFIQILSDYFGRSMTIIPSPGPVRFRFMTRSWTAEDLLQFVKDSYHANLGLGGADE